MPTNIFIDVPKIERENSFRKNSNFEVHKSRIKRNKSYEPTVE